MTKESYQNILHQFALHIGCERKFSRCTIRYICNQIYTYPSLLDD